MIKVILFNAVRDAVKLAWTVILIWVLSSVGLSTFKYIEDYCGKDLNIEVILGGLEGELFCEASNE